MNRATVKIDSFKTQNVFLINGNSIQENNGLMNYYSKPITDCAKSILESLEAEFNDNYELEIVGNSYDTKIFELYSSNDDYCKKCVRTEPSINTPTANRIKALNSLDKIHETVAVKLISSIDGIALPEYEGITYSDEGKVLVVSDDIDFINSNNADVAVFVNGKSQITGKTIVFGATEDEAQYIVNGYIDSMFVNPIINAKIKALNLNVDDENALINRVEPIFYTEQKISVEKDAICDVEIKSNPIDASKEGIQLKSDNDNIEINGLSIKAKSIGNSVISIFADSPMPITKIEVNTFKNNFAQSIDIQIKDMPKVMCENDIYDLILNVSPFDAEDLAIIKIESSNPDVAEVKDDKLYIKKTGSFFLKAQGNIAEYEKKYSVAADIKSISVNGIPNKAHIGDLFELDVLVEPTEVLDGSYKWTTTDENVAVIGLDKDKKEVLKAVGIGKATIKCVSIKNPDLYFEKEINVDSSFNRQRDTQYIFYVGLIATLLSLVLMFFKGKAVLFTAIVAIVAIILSLINERDTMKKSLFCLGCNIFAIIIHIIMILIL